MFNKRHDHVDIQRHQHPAADAERGAHQPDQRTLDHENLHDRTRRGAEGAQDGDVGLLVGHRHHQRRDQVERGHRDDQGQDDEHHFFLGLHGGEPGRIRHRPVAHHQFARHAALEFLRHLRRLVHVDDAQAQPGRAIQALHFFGVFKVDERQAGIEFVMASFKNANQSE